MSQSSQEVSGRRSSAVLTPPFVLAVVLLGVAAVLAGPGAAWMNVKSAKEPLPLERSLAELNEAALYPYRVIHRQILEDVIVDALGTNLYLKWTLEDSSVPLQDPLRYADLFVTYYTGGSSLVPHKPDVCYLGQGYAKARPHENIDVDIPSLGSTLREVPIRVCTFAKTAIFGHDETTVIYTFHCNGRFSVRSRGVRVLINSPMSTYAYFSKVEVHFVRASREESIRGATKLFDRVLPVLIRDHWPDFEAKERAAENGADDDSDS